MEITKGKDSTMGLSYPTLTRSNYIEDILLTLADKKTAKEAWDALKTLCLGADRVKKAKI